MEKRNLLYLTVSRISLKIEERIRNVKGIIRKDRRVWESSRLPD